MDFDTSSRPKRPESSEDSSGANGDPPSSASGVSGEEFDYRDPVQTFVSAARGVLITPKSFFRGIARQGSFANPLFFAVACATLASVFSAVVSFFVAVFAGDQGILSVITGLILEILLTPIIALVVLFIVAGIYHLLVMIFARSTNAGFEATFRVAAYSSAIQLFTWLSIIPIAGRIIALVAGIYGLYVAYFGIREVHSTTGQRAAAVVAIPVLVAIILAVVTAIFIASLFSGGSG